MIDIRSVFSECEANHCLQSYSEGEFYIVDKIGKSEVCFSGAEIPYFHVLNPMEKELNFLAIDNCILFDKDGKKCDCALFDDSCFRFIEIKKASKSASRSARREEAILQLKATIQLFYNKLDLKLHELEAYLCVGHRRLVPKASATSQAHIKDLYDNYHKTKLFDCNEITI